MAGLRKRVAWSLSGDGAEFLSNGNSASTTTRYEKLEHKNCQRAQGMGENRPILGVLYWVVCSLLFALLLSFAVEMQLTCGSAPPDDTSSGGSSSAGFREDLVRRHMRYVQQMGARPVGSDANEIHVVRYLLNVLKSYTNLSSSSSPHFRTELNNQLVDYGSFPLTKILLKDNAMVSVYRNIRNIAFRISSAGVASSLPRRPAILLNCHYDSVPGSAGISDAFVNCAVLLEMIRTILHGAVGISPANFRTDMIFLFNGAEENLLQASHAFATRHPWMSDVRFFINLDAAGAGGRQFLFQAGPRRAAASWIVRAYARAFPRPYGVVFGQELFDSGLIPADTDFRIFHQFASIPGLDLAYITNGYVYHTPLDTEERLSPACVGLAGHSLLTFLTEMVKSPRLHEDPAEEQEGNGSGPLVYFDLFGLAMICFDGWWTYVIHYSTVALIVARFLWHCREERGYLRQVSLAVLNHLFCHSLTSLFLVSWSLAIHFFGRRMTWFSNRYNLIGLYLLPQLLSVLVYHHHLARNLIGDSVWPSARAAHVAHSEAVQILFALLIAALTYSGLGSTFFFVPWVLAGVFWNLLECRLIRRRYDSQLGLAVGKVAFFSLPYTLYVYFLYTTVNFFIPILGRVGQAVYPDLCMVGLLLLGGFPPLSHFVNDIYLTHRRSLSVLTGFLLHATITCLLLVNLTSLGWPYTTGPLNPRPQRVGLVHLNRIWRRGGGITSRESVIVFLPMDNSGVSSTRASLNRLLSPGWTECQMCLRAPYCGFPHLYPVADLFRECYSVPTKAPHEAEPKPQLSWSVGGGERIMNVTFSVEGPSHTHMFIMTQPNRVSLEAWSFTPGRRPVSIPVPATANDTAAVHYFVYNSYGIRPEQPLIFWALFRVWEYEEQPGASVVEVALSASYLHGDAHISPELRRALDRLPPWATPHTWSNTYDHYTVGLLPSRS